MCGILGLMTSDVDSKNSISSDLFKKTLKEMFRLSESRGKEASGLVGLMEKKLYVYKEAVPASTLINGIRFKKTLKKLIKPNFPSAIIGHSRLVTNGLQTDNNNNQPVATSQIVGLHNGVVANLDSLSARFSQLKRHYDVDTEIIFLLIDWFYKKNKSLPEALIQTYKLVEGSASIAFFKKNCPYLTLATNTGSIYLGINKIKKIAFFVSEKYILEKIINDKLKILGTWQKFRLESGQACLINLRNLLFWQFDLKKKKFNIPSKFRNSRFDFSLQKVALDKAFKGHDFLDGTLKPFNFSSKFLKDHRAYQLPKLKLCKKCLLPESMPLIDFDKKGVCNYCRHHKKIKVQGRQALEKILSKYRSRSNKPDCILAFSGGRDSAYGLHYLKKVLKMNPIAYTYDWGMVTDLARRNQARMVGKLGVEHIIVSANIAKKRRNIRKNVKAWLKKPDLGMVPLFMAGDKQAEYYAMQLVKKTGIKLVVYCRGNELENEEFKWGHCGIKEGSPQGVLHNLSLKGKLQLAWYYGRQYLKNPAYINSSIIDTLFAYFVAYMMPLDFIYLWHYIKWDEKKIITTLTKEYGWETAKEAPLTTWRIDDGSVPFYNYIYATLQGFTENDTFRSNQIREGIIGRKEALSLVKRENMPRWEGLRWYFEQIGIDGEKAIEIIDKTSKSLYRH